MASGPEIASLTHEHLPGVIELFAGERWSYADDEQRAWRALTAPGVFSLVALSSERAVIGVTQILSDGEVQAFLAVLVVLVVSRKHRREGVWRLVEEARARTHDLRLDVISCADPFYEQLGFRRVSGFRLPAT